MRYIKTFACTNFKKQKITITDRILNILLFFIPKANPDYEPLLHLVKQWLIEFDENEMPYREIGLDKNNNIIIAGPDKTNYGFWLDTNLKINDFNGVEIDKLEFEEKWNSFSRNS